MLKESQISSNLDQSLDRTYVFEFAGMPKSGKTTILDVVSHYLKRSGYPVREFHGGGRYVEIDKNNPQALNLVLTTRAIEYLLLSLERYKDDPRIILMDRGVFDKSVFTISYFNEGKLSRDEADALTNFLMIPRLVESIDGVFPFITTPELSLEREYRNKLIHQEGRVMNYSMLSKLREATITQAQTLANKYRYIQIVDTGALDGNITQTATLVIDGIKRVMNMDL